MKTKGAVLLFFLIQLTIDSVAADYVFDYNKKCRLAYRHYMALHLPQGNAVIRQEIKSNPYNLMATYIADYEDCLLLLFNGDKADYEQRGRHMEERLAILSKGDDRSPWYRLCKAGIYFHWALVHVRFSENLKAATLFRKSFILMKENGKLHPDFAQNKIFLGVEEAVVGTIPDDYKWLAAVFGMKGNVKRGAGELASFVGNTGSDEPLREEAVIYYVYLRFYLLSQQQEVWNYLNSSQFDITDNLFHTFIKANIAINFRKGEDAIQTLKAAHRDAEYRRFPILDYETGSAMLHKLDPSSIGYFQKFLERYNGTYFVKETWQKIAYAYYLQQNLLKAEQANRQILNSGSKQVDADKQAHRFAETARWPPLPLLQARLLTDGGYYTQALQKLQGFDPNSLSIENKLEYYFRLARIQDELGNDVKALALYQAAINTGRNRKEHYAARSALQMGMLYERSGKKAEALAKYNECLTMKNHDFQSNIDQQAKAGINRLTKY